MLRTLLFLLTLLIAPSSSTAAQVFEAKLADGAAVPIEQFAAAGDSLVLWLPSEHGVQSAQSNVARELAQRGIEVWNADPFAGYFLAPSTDALHSIADDVIAQLIDIARTRSNKKLFLLSNDQGAALALQGARRWQTMHENDTALRGAILISPNLLTRTPEAGQDAQYRAIARATNLPIFILQPSLAVGYWQLQTLTAQLEHGGSRVYTRILRDVRDRFYFRSDASLNEAGTTERLPEIIDASLVLLAREKVPRHAAALEKDTVPTPPREEHRLKPYTGNARPPPLSLTDRAGAMRTLDEHRGRVVLVNFWASWCPPCVHEMPSMQQLHDRLHDKPFDIVAVNMAESPATIDGFMQQHKLNFDAWTDRDGAALRQWKIMAYPTSFVLDKRGRIRYAVFGAIDWMDADTVRTLETLLAERAP